MLKIKNDHTKIPALINFVRKVNTMTLAFITKLIIKIPPINVRTQKIYSFNFKMFEMILVNFQVKKKPKKIH